MRIGRWAQDAPQPLSRAASAESGFSLMEAIVATVISVIAILGLAHTFGMGRGFIERFAMGRTALSLARARMESFTVQPDSIALHDRYVQPFNHHGKESGTIEWKVLPYDDPQLPGAYNLRNVVVTLRWGQGDSLHISRLFQP